MTPKQVISIMAAILIGDDVRTGLPGAQEIEAECIRRAFRVYDKVSNITDPAGVEDK